MPLFLEHNEYVALHQELSVYLYYTHQVQQDMLFYLSHYGQ